MSIPLDVVVDLYFNKNESIVTIAEQFNTYPAKISRLLKKNGYVLRTKTESQKLALQEGRSEHPTKGKKMSDETKAKLGEAMANVWASMDAPVLEQRKEKLRERWAELSDKDKASMQEAAHKQVRATTVHGSQLEKHLLAILSIAGYLVEFHKKDLMTTKLEVDIFLPELNIAIEVDGPSHFLPIWGEDALKKQQTADELKFGILAASNIKLIRVQNKRRHCSDIIKRRASEGLMDAIERMKADNSILRLNIDT